MLRLAWLIVGAHSRTISVVPPAGYAAFSSKGKEGAQDALKGALHEASSAAKEGKQEQKGQDDKENTATPTYTYASPGSSMKDPRYGISFSDPVYVVDPAPKPKRTDAVPGGGVKPEEAGEDFQQPGSDGFPKPPSKPGSS